MDRRFPFQGQLKLGLAFKQRDLKLPLQTADMVAGALALPDYRNSAAVYICLCPWYHYLAPQADGLQLLNRIQSHNTEKAVHSISVAATLSIRHPTTSSTSTKTSKSSKGERQGQKVGECG